MAKLTRTQRAVLEHCVNGGAPWTAPKMNKSSRRPSNQGGARMRMITRLVDQGYLNSSWTITEAGRAALRERE